MTRFGFALALGLALASFGCKTSVIPQSASPQSASGDLEQASRDPDVKSSPAAKVPLPEKATPIDTKGAEKRVEAFARYATGITYELNDKGDEALGEFYKSALANPSNEALVIELASRLSQSKQNDKAAEVLQKSCERKDASGAVFAILSKIQLRTGKTNAALRSAQIAIKRSPTMISGHEALSSYYLASDKPQDALKVLDRAAGQIKQDPPLLIGLAELYANYCKQFPKQKEAIAPRAKELLGRAAKQEPKAVVLRQKLAEHLAYFGDSKGAAEIYLALLSDDSEEADVWRDLVREKLANIYMMQNDKTNAAAQLENIIRDNPTKYPQAYYILGTIAYDRKDFKRAAECFEKTILLSPELEQAYYDLAGTQINMNQANRALALLDKARARFDSTFVNEFFSAIACNKLKKYNDAVKHYMAAEMLAKTADKDRLDHTFYFQVGSCYERLKNYPEAEKYFEKALEKSPNDAETLNYLGYMWADNGTNLVKAKELIQKAVKLEPKNAAYLDSLGWVFFKSNEAQQALPFILKAIELSEEPDPALYDHLGDIYNALKQTDKAEEAWKKSLSIEPNDDIKKKLSHTL